MKATIKLLEKQHAALVQVIQFLDSHKHSNEPVRETVDRRVFGGPEQGSCW